MSYTLDKTTGKITNDLTGVVVNELDSVDDPEFIQYQTWINSTGNTYTVIESVQPRRRIQVDRAKLMIAMHRYSVANGIIPTLLDMVQAIVSSPGKEEVKILWEAQTEFWSDNELVLAVGQLANLTEEQVYDVFLLAETISLTAAGILTA